MAASILSCNSFMLSMSFIFFSSEDSVLSRCFFSVGISASVFFSASRSRAFAVPYEIRDMMRSIS